MVSSGRILCGHVGSSAFIGVGADKILVKDGSCHCRIKSTVTLLRHLHASLTLFDMMSVCLYPR